MVIAIDGPAGAGKSTVARALAERLGFTYLDTGAMYRCVALLSIERPAVEPAALAREARIAFVPDTGGSPDTAGSPDVDGSHSVVSSYSAGGTPGADDLHGAGGAPDTGGAHSASAPRVLLDGRDASAAIRALAVSEAASRVAADPAVREALVARQRQLLAGGDWVAEGRDIATVVAPDAELKVFLTADPSERARRRADELGAERAAIEAEQALRDRQDTGFGRSTLEPAPGAVSVDTTGLTVEQVVERIAALVDRARPSG
jgi:CMP/dCMP kinase